MKILKNKVLEKLFLSIIVFNLSMMAYYLNIFDYIEHKTYDKLIKSTANSRQPSEDIIVVLVDQSSLDWAQKEKNWSWPWPREAYGDIANFFALGQAKSVAFDILFTEQSAYSSIDDQIFANAIKKSNNCIFALQFGQEYGDTEYWHEGISPPNTKFSGYTKEYIEKNIKNQSALFPIDVIAQSATSFGMVSSLTDKDGIIRRSNIFTIFDNVAVPSLGLSGLTFNNSEGLSFELNDKQNKVKIANKTIQLQKDNSVYLRYRKNIESYVPYFAREILQSYYDYKDNKEPLLLPEDFKDKYVFLGFYAPGLFDIAPTPISTKYPGVGVHITTLDNYLQNDFINIPPKYVQILILLFCSFFGVFVFNFINDFHKTQKFTLILSSISVLLFLIIYIFIATYIFIIKYWLPIVLPIITTVFSFFVTVLVNYNTEGKQRRYLKNAFKQYLSPTVIEQIIADPSKLKLGGERRQISMFFSDIQGFTSISEKMTPEELTTLLNEYLTEMTEIILKAGGTIDKYVGDAIVAFWNAPMNLEDHAFKALKAAIDCQNQLKKMQEDIKKRFNTNLCMRIGLNTGYAVVGNFGSKHRFDYTILGDCVNLTSRLEGINKEFGTYTICTQNLLNCCNKLDEYYLRQLARVMVIGKHEAVTIFEPIPIEEYNKNKEIFNKFSNGLSFFYLGDFLSAYNIFKELQNFDCPSKKYMEKCLKLMQEYPNGKKDFDGIWIANSK